ncbi:hypothetical protein Ddye_013699 [Dipteronia dyeriana]|uniref:Low-temperature-induced 65 kDa protein n=1 Tax=Dipteronia dyeriana TaxID=168575 RepID=A0AAD9X734_9ROSI|nr:hypothetical protein Ddye_013699 [Dipteronia dyeriana]
MEPHMDHGPLHEREPHHTSFGPGHQTVAEGDQGEQPHEKKSVFTKVKAKARKIKDTLTGHGHDNENDLDEEDDEDDQEKFEDPQIHDAPKYDTAGQVGNLGTSRVDHGRSTAMDVDPLETNVKPGSNFDGQERTKGQHKVTLGSVIGEDITHASQKKPVTRYDDATTGIHDHQTKDNVPSNTGMGDLPHEPPFHSPGISHGRDNVPVKGDVLEPPGIHHHSSRDNVPSTRTSDDNVVDRPGIHHKIRDDVSSRTTATDNLERPKGQEEDFAAPKDSFGDYTSANYQTKVTDPTGKDVAGGEAAGVASILQSFEKMKVKDGSEGVGKTRQEHNLPAGRKEDHLPTSVAPTGSHDQFSPELTPPKHLTAGQETFDSPQEHDYLHEHELGTDHRPPSNQSSSYIDKISSPTTAIADKAVSPKNVVGDNDSTTGVHDHEGVGGKPSSDQSSYTEKLSYATSVIADRAISAKNVVALKLGYGEKDSEVPGTGTFSTANQQQQQEGVEGNNQERGGGGSVKGYLAEKLRPGEEDKALSEVITETLHKPKPEQQQQQQLKQESPRPVREVVSDAMHKRNDDPDGEVNRPMGKVTESDEVARRLGHTQDDQALGNKGMVDKIKGAVGSWLGKGDQSPGKGDQSPRSQTGSARDDTGHNSN